MGDSPVNIATASSVSVVLARHCRPLGRRGGALGAQTYAQRSLFPTTMPASVASLDSIDLSEASYDEDEEERLAQLEWEESLEQLQDLFALVLLPYLGKWMGRRWSHWGTSTPRSLHSTTGILIYFAAYARYLRLGLGQSFFLGERSIDSRRR